MIKKIKIEIKYIDGKKIKTKKKKFKFKILLNETK